MKHFLLFMLITGFFFPVQAQFHWQPIGGPEGGRIQELYNNDDYAFYLGPYNLYRSSDGVSWEGLPANPISPLAVHGSTLVGQFFLNWPLSNKTTLKISHDNGETWAAINKPSPSLNILNMAVCSHGIYIQANVLYRSQDEGLTWTVLSSPVPYGSLWTYDDRLYTVNYFDLYRTDSNGENWTKVTPPLGNNSGTIRSVFAHGPHLLAASDFTFWHSHDNGQSWNSSPMQWFVQDIGFTLIGNELFVIDGYGHFFKSSNYGITLTKLPVDPVAVLANAGGYPLVGAYNAGIKRWDASTQQLVESNQGLSSAVVEDLDNIDGEVWACTPVSVSKYNPISKNWTKSSLPIPYDHYEMVPTNYSGQICVYSPGDDHFYLSNNHGLSWTPVYPSALNNKYAWGVVLINQTIFARNHALNDAPDWIRSTDFGQTWQLITNTGSSSALELKNIFQFQGQMLALDPTGKLQSSPDQGLTWNSFSTFNQGPIQRIFITPDRLFAYVGQTHQGFIYSSANGVDWQYAQDGLPLNIYYNLSERYAKGAFFSKDGKYYFLGSNFYASTDTCKTWLPIERNHGLSFFTLLDTTFYAGSFFGGGVTGSGLPALYDHLVTGTVFKDDNGNGIRDAGEAAIPGAGVSLNATYGQAPFYMTTTQADGSYVLGVRPGAYDTLRPVLHSAYVESILPPYRLVGNGGADLDFAVKMTPDVTDLTVEGNYAGRPRPGFALSLFVNYTNAGTTQPSDAQLSVKLDSHLNYLDATPAPTAVFGDSLVWSLAQLPVFNNGYIQINAQLPASTLPGLKLNSICRINTSAGDVNTIDNQSIASDVVVGSYNPNEKRVAPADGLTTAEIAEGKDLLYTIQFQNTGTSAAGRVRITDVIDTALYLPSLRLLSASHPVTTFQLLPGRLLEIVLEGIMLPNSNSNEPGSHGFVTFAIQRKKAFNPDYKVRNHAAIFFDFNNPIMTNEVVTPIKAPSVSVIDIPEKQAPTLLIFPNPADHVCTVSTEGQLSGPGLLVLQNTAGQICQQRRVTAIENPVTIITEGLPDGIYLVRLLGGDRSLAGKVAVHRK